MTRKPYLGASLSLDPPPGHHYHENALVGDPRAPRNTSFMKNLTFSFFVFATFRLDFNIFLKIVSESTNDLENSIIVVEVLSISAVKC